MQLIVEAWSSRAFKVMQVHAWPTAQLPNAWVTTALALRDITDALQLLRPPARQRDAGSAKRCGPRSGWADSAAGGSKEWGSPDAGGEPGLVAGAGEVDVAQTLGGHRWRSLGRAAADACGRAAGQDVLRSGTAITAHRDSWVTEHDFVTMAGAGVNAVRLPVGYWVLADTAEAAAPFVEGGLQYVDKAMEWGAAHGIGVLIDMHAAPGSQNGFDHSAPAQKNKALWDSEQQPSPSYPAQTLQSSRSSRSAMPPRPRCWALRRSTSRR